MLPKYMIGINTFERNRAKSDAVCRNSCRLLHLHRVRACVRSCVLHPLPHRRCLTIIIPLSASGTNLFLCEERRILPLESRHPHLFLHEQHPPVREGFLHCLLQLLEEKPTVNRLAVLHF